MATSWAGAIIARSELLKAMRRESILLGMQLDPHAAFLIMRGMKTYYLRCEAQAASAGQIAQVPRRTTRPSSACTIRGCPRIRATRLPGNRCGTSDRSSPSTSRAARRRCGNSPTRSNSSRSRRASVRSSRSSCRRSSCVRAGSLPSRQAIGGIGEGTIRLAIGIEDTEDLIEDLDAALNAVK